MLRKGHKGGAVNYGWGNKTHTDTDKNSVMIEGKMYDSIKQALMVHWYARHCENQSEIQ